MIWNLVSDTSVTVEIYHMRARLFEQLVLGDWGLGIRGERVSAPICANLHEFEGEG